MKHRSSAFLLVTLILISVPLFSVAQEISKDAAEIAAGKALFNANCKSCHGVDKKVIGPALQGVTGRAPSIPWIINWVHNSPKVIAAGDKYGVALYEEYKSQMTAFTNLTEPQIMQILAFVEAPVVAATAAEDPNKPPVNPGVPAAYLNAIVIGMGVILILLFVTLLIVAKVLRSSLTQRTLDEADEQIVNSPYTFGSIVRSPGFAFVVVFIVGGITFKTVIDGLYTVGVQQNYQPKQPIAFSHKIHAGQFEIDCKYCHTGVMKGKQANIPSPNMCMNCHSQIREGTNTGAGEIAKIYSAVGYNPDQGTYSGVTKPIQWIRIHNLPDLAYFNHSQHVNVGGVACETCHGPVKEMEIVKQYSLLTMGWCINCHRKTDVNAKGNAYYDKLLEVHDPNNTGKKMKVEEIGGLECGKCHY
ncbi:MAG TPA: cytochrome c3 family protein [Cyclobacteriaceae bacterium]|nr:cytochrome c3 family protein [Cyclobacteriaceae bacterium]